MFVQHLKFALRNIFKSKIYSLFNIVGFAMGFTICIITGLYIYREFNMDKSFEDYQHIYRLVDAENNISTMDYDLAEKLRDRFPEIEKITPVLYNYTYEILLKRPQTDHSISIQNLICTEKDFFDIFTLDFMVGNPSDPFNGETSVVVTNSLAEKLFGRTDVLGELVSFFSQTLPVSAVIREMPENFSMNADLIINSETGIVRFSEMCMNGNETCYNPYPIYVLLNEGTNIQLLTDKINSHFPENYSETNEIKFQPLTDIYFDKTVTDNQNLSGSYSLIFIFITIAAIVLVLSVINYVNFALSQQLDTLKQLGIKITYGASMNHLREYYIVEIGLSVFLSFVLSLFLSVNSIALFENVLGVHLNMMHMFQPVFLLSMLCILVMIILISSLTPFYIISKFDVQMLFGKKRTIFGKQRGKMILTGCQIAITVVMFVCLFMLHKQLGYVKGFDLGFDKDHLVRIEMPGPNGYDAFKNIISQYDFVENVVSSEQAPGFMSASEGQRHAEEERYISIEKIYTEPGFIETFGLQLLEGRDFTDADRMNACIVTEETMRQLGWENIEGKRCTGYQVIGVVKDFNVSSLHNRMETINIIPLSKENILGAPLTIHIKGNIPDALDRLRTTWNEVFPGEPFNFRFYDEVFDAYYKKEERQTSAIAIISIIAIVITCMGLIGQVKQTSVAKAKEIGIRKINGATIAEMMLVIPNSFLKSFAVAFVFSIPIGWYVIEQWLQNFAFKTTITWWIFALSGVVVFLLLAIFILWQTWKAATANPVDIIKSE